MMRRYSQENYLEGLQQKYCRGGQIKSMRDRERENGKKIEINGNIPWDKKS